MGTPEFACEGLKTLVESDHVVSAVVTAPDKPAGRGRKLMPSAVKTAAQTYGLDILQPEKLRDNAFIDQISAYHADIFIVIAFRILPKKLYSLPEYGSINIHGSLLPKYRGAAPINHAILNGETETGLTAFFLNKKIDGGAIIGQVSTPIDPNENFSSLYARLAALSGPFLLSTLDTIADPGFSPRIQPDGPAGDAPKIAVEDCLIDWTQPANRIHNHIRAYSEKPGAFCFLDAMKIKILAARPNGISDHPSLKPGEILARNKELIVGTGTTPVRITTIQPEGKKAMSAEAFINGYMSSTPKELTAHRKEVKN